MPNLGTTELLIIAGVLMLLFGAAKLPKLARSLGESARIFRSETKGLRSDDEDPESPDDQGSSRVKQITAGQHSESQLGDMYTKNQGDLNKSG